MSDTYNYYGYPQTYDSELQHYGVKGMKWGVRNGTYVHVTLQKKHGDDYNSRQRETMKRQASKVLSGNIKRSNKAAMRYQKGADKFKAKSELYKAKGDTAKAQMTAEKARNRAADAKAYINHSKAMTQRLKDVNSNRLKAGKDYVVNTTVGTDLLLDAMGYINIGFNREVDFRK